jgi:CelD/BcsL family acetyltransferase involved in cellulose biosynthesis
LADALDLKPGVWDELVARSGTGDPFMTWAWHRAWAEGSETHQVESARVVVLQSAVGELEALLPFRVYRTQFRHVPVVALGWAIGDLGCPDHLELPASPEADLDALVGVLEDVPWDVIVLSNVADSASNIDRFSAACERRGWKARRTALWRCPYLELPVSWDAYLSRLSPTRRQTIRRKERKLRREHQVALTEYEGSRRHEGWRHLTRLHGLRWRGAGVFREPALERVHQCFASSLASRQLWLTTLDVDGAPVAAWYGFSFADTVYYYQGGWDPQWEHHSVGMILMGAMIRRAIERRYRIFDFLRGEEPGKMAWTSTARACYELVVIRPGGRGALLRGLDWCARELAPRRGRHASAVWKQVTDGDFV